MRTTLDLDEDVLIAAKELARQEGVSTGKSLSNLARRGLANAPKSRLNLRDGVPVIPSRGEIITTEHVQRLLDSEGV